MKFVHIGVHGTPLKRKEYSRFCTVERQACLNPGQRRHWSRPASRL